jgi:hypothetical protein
VVALVVMLAHNVVSMARNQVGLPCKSRVCVKPRDLEHLSTGFGGPKVAARKAVFHHLGRRIPGAELTVPAWMARGHLWELEHIARVDVRIADDPMLLDTAQIEELRAGRNITRTWLARNGNAEERRYRKLMVLIEEGADAYVLAEERGGAEMMVVMPLGRYREVTAR